MNKTEVLLWECLLEISKLEKKLGKSLSSLPKSLIEVAPSRAQGVPNGTRAEKEKNIWLGRTEAKKPPTVNSKQNDSSSKQMSPYQVIGENSYKYQRQELFSFAAASLGKSFPLPRARVDYSFLDSFVSKDVHVVQIPSTSNNPWSVPETI